MHPPCPSRHSLDTIASMGFEKSGYLVGVGFKLGNVLDCQFMSRYLVPIKPDNGTDIATQDVGIVGAAGGREESEQGAVSAFL